MYTFRNDKVRLRARTMSDAEAETRWRNDTAVTRTALYSGPRSREEQERIIRDGFLRANDYNFAIEAIDLPQPLHIGGCGLHHLDWRGRNAEFGIAIGEKAYWGNGYGTAATQLILEFGFGELNLHRIYLYVFDFNQRGIRTYEKVGFKHEAMMRDDIYREGQFHNTRLMGILKSEWEQSDQQQAT